MRPSIDLGRLLMTDKGFELKSGLVGVSEHVGTAPTERVEASTCALYATADKTCGKHVGTAPANMWGQAPTEPVGAMADKLRKAIGWNRLRRGFRLRALRYGGQDGTTSWRVKRVA